jgi:V8-like Glu-specific endopeptidase
MQMKSLFLSLALCASAQVLAGEKVIYGQDDRLDVNEATNSLHVELSLSTAAMIDHSSLQISRADSTYKVNGSALTSMGICATERFAQQMTAAMCSGFLVAPDLLVTAGHCIRSQSDCTRYAWVFDYKQPDAAEAQLAVPMNSVYSCKEIIERSLDNSTMDDYALVRLDRAVTDRAPLTFRKSGKVANGAPLVVIGHPSGLPTKIADGAFVRNNTKATYFAANLDTYGGNSGSAVFDAETGVIEGILVRGETDYVYNSSRTCRVSNYCADNGCRGEDVTRITNIKALQSL